ncbi:unnamed protein product [Vitrella brassicaformis CCMP3155]|uniref:Uncharacterized protein n=1 Tax=Vitrella brassicaformis (strain CCMP3155) TaxID=1169540 RepID=A0A0G4ECZ6_VITBC|nr:unnamed protein product [Vitrella brassicaformis CCMP3155]|eukprot:CEL93432.1 unnamed protein product [Vitrella brassicaformis CCMP3155]
MDGVRALKELIEIADPLEQGGAIEEQEVIGFISAIQATQRTSCICTATELERLSNTHHLWRAVGLAAWLKAALVDSRRELVLRYAWMAISDFYFIHVKPRNEGQLRSLLTAEAYRALCSEGFPEWRKEHYSRMLHGKEGRCRCRTAKTRKTVVHVAAHQSDVRGVRWHEQDQAWVAQWQERRASRRPSASTSSITATRPR